MHGDIVGVHWQELEELLLVYHAITACEVFDRKSTSFWLDRWLFAGRLRDLFPLLHTHATDVEVSVSRVVQDGIEQHLVPRIS